LGLDINASIESFERGFVYWAIGCCGGNYC
jgi:hypothetical protein